MSLQGLRKKLQSWKRECAKSAARASSVKQKSSYCVVFGFFFQGELHHGSPFGAKYASQRKKIRLDLRSWQHIFLDFLVLQSQNSICAQLFNVSVTELCESSLFFFHAKLKNISWIFRAGFLSFPRKLSDDKFQVGLLRDTRPMILPHVTYSSQ